LSTSCIKPEDLGGVADLAPDHPVRLHLSSCARCQARWKAYLSFLADKDPIPGARDEAAGEVLAGLIDLQFGTAAPVRRVRRSPFDRWKGRFLILTPAAAVIVVALLILGHGERGRAPEQVLRGPETAAIFGLEIPVVQPDGRLRLAWRALAGADAYRVRVFNTGLDRVFESPAQSETTLVLTPSEFRPAGPPGSPLLWRVIALRRGEEMGMSDAGTLRMP
jgi:hypothetical protein